MKYEQIVLEFSNYIWYLQTHADYKAPPEYLYEELTKRITLCHYNLDKFYCCQNMRNILNQIEEDVEISRNVCMQIKSGYDKTTNFI